MKEMHNYYDEIMEMAEDFERNGLNREDASTLADLIITERLTPLAEAEKKRKEHLESKLKR